MILHASGVGDLYGENPAWDIPAYHIVDGDVSAGGLPVSLFLATTEHAFGSTGKFYGVSILRAPPHPYIVKISVCLRR